MIPITAQEDDQPTAVEWKIFELVNNERIEQGRKELQFHSGLMGVARSHSEDMLRNNYFDHVNLQGEDPFDRMNKAGIIYSSGSENLYFATGQSDNSVPENAFEGWKGSSGHYQNMLSIASYTGIGVAKLGDVYYVTQLFVEATEDEILQSGNVITEYTDQSNFIRDNFAIITTSGIIIIFIILERFTRKR